VEVGGLSTRSAKYNFKHPKWKSTFSFSSQKKLLEHKQTLFTENLLDSTQTKFNKKINAEQIGLEAGSNTIFIASQID
jgi:hypothetical protein